MALLAFRFPSHELYLVDPMHASPSEWTSQAAFQIIRELLRNKFPNKFENINIVVPNHITQNDSTSCGVFVCWYARQILENRSLCEDMSPIQTRYEIFQTVVGHCLNQRGVSESPTECGQCGDSSGDQWIQCDRCDQWHHSLCVGISRDTTMYFFCPQ